MCIVSTHRFLFPVSDAFIAFKQVMTSSICLEWIREDAGSPGEAEPSEGGEGGLNVDMGERKKKGSRNFGIHNPYICA